MIAIRPIRIEDSASYLHLCNSLDAESPFMLLEPGERLTTVEEQSSRIEAILATDNQMVLVAEMRAGGYTAPLAQTPTRWHTATLKLKHPGPILVAYIAGLGGQYRRNRHCVHVTVGVLETHTGQGLGKRLFHALESWAVHTGLRRLELTVMVHNKHAVDLYRQLGFQIEGLREDSLLVNGVFVDEYFMAKMLG